jgi:hypothetical protein
MNHFDISPQAARFRGEGTPPPTVEDHSPFCFLTPPSAGEGPGRGGTDQAMSGFSRKEFPSPHPLPRRGEGGAKCRRLRSRVATIVFFSGETVHDR